VNAAWTGALERHVMEGDRLYADDTTVPICQG
jgi:hypothetical protein